MAGIRQLITYTTEYRIQNTEHRSQNTGRRTHEHRTQKFMYIKLPTFLFFIRSLDLKILMRANPILGPTPSNGPCNGSCRHQNHYIPPHINNNWYINSYLIAAISFWFGFKKLFCSPAYSCVQVEPSCSITGEGLDLALEILHQLIQKRKKIAKRNRNKTK